MKTLVQEHPLTPSDEVKGITRDLYEKIISYYEDAGPDYQFWSKEYNMHFGYGNWINLFSREKMLQRMNAEVIKRLKINDAKDAYVLDMGCGLGATLRQAAKSYPQNHYIGLTLVPWQVNQARELNRKTNKTSSVYIMEGDYINAPFPDHFFDAAFAIESSCHSPGQGKEYFVSEMTRLLKPGGRFVIADAFVKRNPENFNPLIRKFYEWICESWALPNIGQLDKVKENLLKKGLKNIVIEDISWKVAPSVLHNPFVIARFILHNWIKGKKFKEQSRKNLIGSFSSLMLGLSKKDFGYYLISGEKMKSKSK